jgi:hypothetical protein
MPAICDTCFDLNKDNNLIQYFIDDPYCRGVLAGSRGVFRNPVQYGS